MVTRNEKIDLSCERGSKKIERPILLHILTAVQIIKDQPSAEFNESKD